MADPGNNTHQNFLEWLFRYVEHLTVLHTHVFRRMSEDGAADLQQEQHARLEIASKPIDVVAARNIASVLRSQVQSNFNFQTRALRGFRHRYWPVVCSILHEHAFLDRPL